MKRHGFAFYDLLTYAIVALALVVFLAPVLWMLITLKKVGEDPPTFASLVDRARRQLVIRIQFFAGASAPSTARPPIQASMAKPTNGNTTTKAKPMNGAAIKPRLASTPRRPFSPLRT